MSMPTTYRGSMTREQWLVNETRVVARLMADENLSDTKEIIEKVTAQNLFQYPTEREQKSITRACCRRLLALSEDEDVRASLINLAAHGSLEQLAQVNLYAMMCDNRVVWDFMTCVIAPKFSLLISRFENRRSLRLSKGFARRTIALQRGRMPRAIKCAKFSSTV